MFIVSSMCGHPKKPEDRQHYHAENYLLLRDGQPWRTLMPLPRLTAELAASGFIVFKTSVSENPCGDHATLCCRLI